MPTIIVQLASELHGVNGRPSGQTSDYFSGDTITTVVEDSGALRMTCTVTSPASTTERLYPAGSWEETKYAS